MRTTRSIIIFDLDGTLADIQHRRWLLDLDPPDWRTFYAKCPADLVNHAVATAWDAHGDAGHFLWIVSGRSKEVENETKDWLRRHSFYYDKLLMREDGDHQPDVKLKQGWIDDGTIPKAQVVLVYDDRTSVVNMWRANGIPCFQVAPGDF